MLDRSLDPRQTMRAIAQMVVPGLAEMCVLDLLAEDGAMANTQATARDEDALALFHSLRAEHPLDLAGEHPAARAIRLREPVSQALARAPIPAGRATEPELHGLAVQAGYRSVVSVPLIARGRLLGALSLFDARKFALRNRSRIELIASLADRAATALDNANLYVARTQLARTLQRSLLPESLPVIDGVALSSAYHPAGEGNEVGGDFYDVFTTPFGSWLVVGDVCGKGPEAAAVTALVRHSIRAFAFVRASPAQVLGAVNEVMLGHALAKRFATVVAARLDLRRRPVRMTMAGAGHPPPVLLGADGPAECPSVEGMMLGVRSGSNAADIQIALYPGSTLLLYTDGLLDAGAPRRGLTPPELCGALAGHAGAAPQLLVQQLERLALSSGAGRLRDDVAILAARVDN